MVAVHPENKPLYIDHWASTLETMRKRRNRAIKSVLDKIKESGDIVNDEAKIKDLYVEFQISTDTMIRGLMGEPVDPKSIEPKPYGEGRSRNVFLRNEFLNWQQAAKNLGYTEILLSDREIMRKIDIEVDSMRDEGTAKPGLRP